LKINFRHERTHRTVPFCTMEATSARLAEGWHQATTILIRVDPWKATSFSHVFVCLFLQGMRRGRPSVATRTGCSSAHDRYDSEHKNTSRHPPWPVLSHQLRELSVCPRQGIVGAFVKPTDCIDVEPLGSHLNPGVEPVTPRAVRFHPVPLALLGGN
jgi:hypothetical protein